MPGRRVSPPITGVKPASGTYRANSLIPLYESPTIHAELANTQLG